MPQLSREGCGRLRGAAPPGVLVEGCAFRHSRAQISINLCKMLGIGRLRLQAIRARKSII